MTRPRQPFPWWDDFERSLLDVACPTCKSKAGQPCVILRGPEDRHTHLGRADRAVRKHRREEVTSW